MDVSVQAGGEENNYETLLCASCAILPRDIVNTTQTHEVSDLRFSYPSLWFAEGCNPQCQYGNLMRATAQEYNVTTNGVEIDPVFSSDQPMNGDPILFRITDTSTRSVSAITRLRSCGWLVCEQLPRSRQDQTTQAGFIETDWDLVQSWFRDCQSVHGSMCEPQPLKMPGLSMIDCVSRSIVSAPEKCHYAALSYVWGMEPKELLAFESAVPSSFVQVVEDAIRCTIRLGLRFLWVDRYCIDQASPDKHRQIQNMDQIYGSATITLINAAGESPHDGLPGVFATAKTERESFMLEGRKANPISNVRREIRESTWSSRGWTFQEGLLSIRRLVFTKSQAYYQCTAMHRCESIPHQLLTHPTSKVLYNQRFNEAMLALPQLYRDSSYSLMAGFDVFLTEYLRRQLSYQSDALNAFMGFLRYFWKQQERPIWHFWGVPFWSALNDGYSSGNFVFIKQLLWVPVQRPGSGQLIKREGFPSWTWAAWEGLASWILTDAIERRLIWDKYFDVRIRVEDQSGDRLDMSEYVGAMNRNFDLYNFKPYLYLSGWSVKARFRPLAPYSQSDEAFLLDAFDAARNVAIARVKIMNVHRPDDPSWSLSSLSEGTWRLLLFVGRDVTDTWSGQTKDGIKVRVTGLVLNPTPDNRAYTRLGVLDCCDRFELQVRAGNKRARLWRGSPKQWFDCKWHNIKLL